MKCTSCQTSITPVIALDIDGTLGRYHEHFTQFLNNYLCTSFDAREYTGEDEFKAWFNRGGISNQTYREVKLAYRQGGLKRTMPAYADFLAEAGPRALYSPAPLLPAGTEVWIATTRPYMRLDNIDPDTREWLSRQNIEFNGLLYGDDKYEMLIDRVGKERIAFVLDDLPEQYDRAEALGLPVWQVKRTHNSASVAARPRRVYAWQVGNKALEEVGKWRSNQNEGSLTPSSS